jgi:tRNA A37 threonylcarbamoyladenosine dehydratase
MSAQKGIFQRTELLLGSEIMSEIAQKKVIIFGIGGVGSWCAESLVRSGIQDLTIVDSDRISVSNINRQLHATTATVGAVKTEVLKSRLLEINPAAHITGIQRVYNDKNSASFGLENYDYIVDAIDSLSYKIDLIRKATRTPATLFSSMGASLKIDPTRVKVAEFFDVKGCPLGSIVRKRIRRGDLPAKKFLCVYSDEILETGGSMSPEEEPKSSPPLEAPVAGDPSLAAHDWSDRKAVINGTIAHITAIFGFTLAGLIIQDIYRRYQSIATANEPEPAPNP